MPRKVYSIENLDCANCAAKAEAKIRQVPGVEEASITFATMQLRVAAEDPDALLPQILAAAQSVEPDIRFLPRKEHSHESHSHAHSCSCGCSHDHAHEHEHEHSHEASEEHHHAGNDSELTGILIGAGLFAAGILLEWLLPALPLHFIAFIAGYLILGWNVLLTAGKNIVRGKVFDENFLMGLATLGAFAIGEFGEAVGVIDRKSVV